MAVVDLVQLGVLGPLLGLNLLSQLLQDPGVMRVAPFDRRLRITDPAALSAHYVPRLTIHGHLPESEFISQLAQTWPYPPQPYLRPAPHRSAIRIGGT